MEILSTEGSRTRKRAGMGGRSAEGWLQASGERLCWGMLQLSGFPVVGGVLLDAGS